LALVVLAVTIKRCFPVRYSPESGVMRSGSGLTVTEVNSDAETTPAEFVAVMVSWITVLVTWFTGSVGAVNVRFPVVAPVGVMVRLTRAGAPVWVTVQARGVSAGTLGSAREHRHRRYVIHDRSQCRVDRYSRAGGVAAAAVGGRQ
jgi:hypothetical protein